MSGVSISGNWSRNPLLMTFDFGSDPPNFHLRSYKKQGNKLADSTVYWRKDITVPDWPSREHRPVGIAVCARRRISRSRAGAIRFDEICL